MRHTALILAARGGHQPVVATPLEHNANVEATDRVSYCDDVYTNGV